MSKVGRNDPCPCGSGNKYKKCCGGSNVIELNPDLYNEELYYLHESLITFALENYEEILKDQTEIYFQPNIVMNSQLNEAYMLSLISWSIFHDPIIENNQTIFDVFYKRHQTKTKRTKTKNTFSKWNEVKASLYETISIDDEVKGLITVQDIVTNETYQVCDSEEADLQIGTISLGTLLPFVGYYQFFFSSYEMPGGDTEEILDMLDDYLTKDSDLTEVFPDVLAEVILRDEDIIVWDNPLHEMVALHFSKHMEYKGFDEDVISTGILLWNIYCEQKNPSIKKLGPYAAALEYLVIQSLFPETASTQSQLAKEYDTSAGTVSTNYRKLMDVLGDDVLNEFIDNEDNMDIPFHNDLTSNQKFLNSPSSLPSLHMEKEIRGIQELLEEQDFSSIEEANDFLNNVLQGESIQPPSESPRDHAQDLIYEAQDASGKNRKQLIDEALNIYPNCSDAYLLLAEDAKSIKEETKLLQQAVEAGKKDLGASFMKENKGHFWMMIETRPFMRAKAAYAIHLETIGLTDDAIKHFEELLELNPNDNQGIRDLLLPLYLESRLMEKAGSLLKQYENDGTAFFRFNKALFAYFTGGLTEKTKASLKEATKQNPFVKDYLLGNKKVPNESYNFIGLGDETEAIAYVQENIHLWQGQTELLAALKKIR